MQRRDKMDITPFLDKTSKTPLYEQLYTYFKHEMIHARITKGMRLPSKRRLSGLLSVSTATVERAYEQLTAEGYVKSQPKIGCLRQKLNLSFRLLQYHINRLLNWSLIKK